MAIEFNFPDVGEGIHEGRVVEWLVAEGETVAEDQPLLKVETDKAVVELPSPGAGTVLKLHAPADAAIEVGDVLVTIGEAGESVSGGGTAGQAPTLVEVPRPKPVEAAPAAPATGRRRPLATPSTRALARQLGVDLASIQGSGTGGRITDEDVKRRAETGRGTAPQAAVIAPVGIAETTTQGEVERIPVSHLRKLIAGAMRASKQILFLIMG